jgi:hypothetical protein
LLVAKRRCPKLSMQKLSLLEYTQERTEVKQSVKMRSRNIRS